VAGDGVDPSGWEEKVQSQRKVRQWRSGGVVTASMSMAIRLDDSGGRSDKCGIPSSLRRRGGTVAAAGGGCAAEADAER
jgi:hypothetical protein